MKRSDLVLSLGQRLLLLLFIFIVCYAITALAVGFLTKILADNIPAALRIGAVVQDVFAFIVPAVATSLIVTRKSAELLCVPRGVSPLAVGLILAMLFVSIPIQEDIIYWNYHIALPAWLESFGQAARELEDANFRTMCMLLDNPSVGALAVNLLIIGFAADMDRSNCLQRNAFSVLWIRTPSTARSLLRLSACVDRKPLGTRTGPYTQQYDVCHRCLETGTRRNNPHR